MKEVVITKKTDDITFEMIQTILTKAHASNKEKGLLYATASQTVDKLKSKIGENDTCFVALVDGQLAATVTVSFRGLNYWYHNGNVAIIKLLGVDPEFKGMHISSKLIEACLAEAEKRGEKIVVADSAEHNEILKNLVLGYGFLTTDYGLYAANNFYTNVYVKWLDGCPYSNIYRKFRYNLKRLYIRTIYKPGKIKRFSFHSKTN